MYLLLSRWCYLIFLRLVVFSGVECSLALHDAQRSSWRSDQENVDDDKDCGMESTQEEVTLLMEHQRMENCTTTTSTSQVSWQHPLLEKPIRHCIISRTASALYLIICQYIDACYYLSHYYPDATHSTTSPYFAHLLAYTCLLACTLHHYTYY